MPCNCAIVPFLHVETSGSQAYEARPLHMFATGPVTGLKIVISAVVGMRYTRIADRVGWEGEGKVGSELAQGEDGEGWVILR